MTGRERSSLREALSNLRAGRPQARLARSLQGRGLVFVHVPKCAGSSVQRGLRRAFRVARRTVEPEESYAAARALLPGEDQHALLIRASELRRDLLHYHLASGASLVTGHAPLGPQTTERFAGTHDFVTLMRSPAERMRSHLAFNRTEAAGHGRTEVTTTRFLETDRARVMGALYVKYLAGLPMNAEFWTRRAIDAAKAQADRLDLIGFTDDMDDFAAALSAQIGRRVRIGHENEGRGGTLPTGLGDRIEALCAPDIEVYAHARARFADRRTARRGASRA